MVNLPHDLYGSEHHTVVWQNRTISRNYLYRQMKTSQLVKASFGPNAQKYADSKIFASGKSLERMLEVVAPRPHWLALDIATGGGHNALAISKHVGRAIATDITPQMVRAARSMIGGGGQTNVDYAEADAQSLPFAGGGFDLVSCRIAPHHFPDVPGFVRECARAVKPGGIIAIIDGATPDDPFTRRYLNAYEKLRDPSHVWQYSANDWRRFFEESRLSIMLVEQFVKRHEFTDYCDRMNVSEVNRQRLRAMLVQAPRGAKEAYQIVQQGAQLWFDLGEVLIVGSTTDN